MQSVPSVGLRVVCPHLCVQGGGAAAAVGGGAGGGPGDGDVIGQFRLLLRSPSSLADEGQLGGLVDGVAQLTIVATVWRYWLET